MRKFSFFLMAAAFLTFAGPQPSQAAQGYSTVDVNVRSGPGTGYSIIDTIDKNRLLDIRACTPNWTWCEVSMRGTRGWVKESQLRAVYKDRRVQISNYGERLSIPAVTFNKNDYIRKGQGDYYRNEANFDHNDRDGYWNGNKYGRHDNGKHKGWYKQDHKYDSNDYRRYMYDNNYNR